MRGERENDSSESTTSRSRRISPTDLRPQARDACRVGGVLDDELDGHAEAVERVLQLVRDRRRGLAHRGEPFDFDERLLGGRSSLVRSRTRCSSRSGASRSSWSRCGSTSPCPRSRAPARRVPSPPQEAQRRAPAARARCGPRARQRRSGRVKYPTRAARRSPRGSARTAGCRPEPTCCSTCPVSVRHGRGTPRIARRASTGANANSALLARRPPRSACPRRRAGRRRSPRPSRASAARARRAEDDASGPVDEHGVGVGGRFSCSAGMIMLSSAERDDAHQRAHEPPSRA